MSPIFDIAYSWYKRFERPISSASLIGGFVFDALTLQRVDEFWENFWVGAHLVIVAGAIFMMNRLSNAPGQEKWHFWLRNIMQFFFGGLLSVFIVFYFRSATISASWPFLALLALAFMANERLKDQYERLSFQLTLLFLCVYLFAIYLVPVISHNIGALVFVISGAVSLVVFGIFLYAIKRLSKDRFVASRRAVYSAVGAIVFVMNALYFTHLIPPIPISLADAGIYHTITKDASGNYVLEGEPHTWLDYFRFVEDVHLVDDEPLYAYTAVFSPTNFSTRIVHEWQRYDEGQGEWVTTAEVPLSIYGGRGEGYRTYSIGAVSPGRWRVNVLTSGGGLIGRINFQALP